jgi:hypothetical protein
MISSNRVLALWCGPHRLLTEGLSVNQAQEIAVRHVTYLHRSHGGCQLDFEVRLIKLKTLSFTDDWGEMNGRGGRCARRPRL